MQKTHNVMMILQDGSGPDAERALLAEKRRQYMANYLEQYKQTEDGQRALAEAQRKYAQSEKGRLARKRANAKFRAKQALLENERAERRVASQIVHRWSEMPEEQAKKYFDQLSATESARWLAVRELIVLRNKQAADGKGAALPHEFMREIT